MIDDLALFDLVYAVISIACLIGLLILTTRPPTPPVSRWTMKRLNERDRVPREPTTPDPGVPERARR